MNLKLIRALEHARNALDFDIIEHQDLLGAPGQPTLEELHEELELLDAHIESLRFA